MKGYLILTTKREGQSLLEPRRDGGGVESMPAMCRRLIQGKTGVKIKEEDILACHPMGIVHILHILYPVLIFLY